MARARRGRVNLLGIDPGYTRQAEREGRAGDAALVAAPRAEAGALSADKVSDASRAIRETEGSETRGSAEAAVPAEAQAAEPIAPADERSEPTTGGIARQVRVGLSPAASERLATLSRERGVSIAVITKALRARVVAEFMILLDRGERPTDQRIHRGGHTERVFIRLQGPAYERARLWFDPMEFGDAAMADALRPVLARLFEDELRRIADG